MQIFFILAGIVAVGVVVGYLAAPLILYLIEILAYGLALLRGVPLERHTRQQLRGFPKLNELPKLVNQPNYHSDSRKHGIQYPHTIHKNRPYVVGGDNIAVINGEPKANTSNKSDYGPANNDSLNMVNCQIVEKFSKAIHNLLSFYSRFYGHSTKVEKNLHTKTLVPGLRNWQFQGHYTNPRFNRGPVRPATNQVLFPQNTNSACMQIKTILHFPDYCAI